MKQKILGLLTYTDIHKQRMCLLRTKPTSTFFFFLQDPFQANHTGTFNFYILALSLTPTATAVPWLSPGCIADVFTPLRGVWESLR